MTSDVIYDIKTYLRQKFEFLLVKTMFTYIDSIN